MRTYTITLAAALLGIAGSALAQQTADVRFDPGTSGTTISGTITGDEYVDYRLGANGGQLLIASIEVDGTNGNGTVYFNVLPPGSDGEAIWIGNMQAEPVAEITLPESGTYTLRTYLMGNDRDTDRTVGYLLRVAIN